jgi:hypothetical protein
MVTRGNLAKRLLFKMPDKAFRVLGVVAGSGFPCAYPPGGHGLPSELHILTLRDPDDCG